MKMKESTILKSQLRKIIREEIYWELYEYANEPDIKKQWGVVLKGGSISSNKGWNVEGMSLRYSFDSEAEAKDQVKRSNKRLSIGERNDYGMKYLAKDLIKFKSGLKKNLSHLDEAKKKVDIASLSVGNTYKDSKGYPVKIVDISGSGSSWKITYQDGHGKKKIVRTSLDKGINLYESVNEGNLPSNIQKWIRDRGSKPSKDVKMIGKWVKKLTGHEISGGVAIGKNYNTLVLDIEHQDAAIHYDTTSGEIKLYKKKIRSFNDFEKVFQANESVNEGTRFRVRKSDARAVTKLILRNGWSAEKANMGRDVRFDIEGDDKKIMNTLAKHGIIISHLDEAKVEDVLKKYVKNPYGIGAERVNDEGKFYSLLFSDSHSREETIKKLRKKGILAKKMRKMMQPKSMEYRYELVLHKESINEDIVRGNEVHAKTKKELKAAIARSMKEILAGKTPKYDIINGMTGEMIGWKDGNDYIWQPNAIPYAERGLK
jgi:hypothetical protein